jgi:hypothetical protein
MKPGASMATSSKVSHSKRDRLNVRVVCAPPIRETLHLRTPALHTAGNCRLGAPNNCARYRFSFAPALDGSDWSIAGRLTIVKGGSVMLCGEILLVSEEQRPAFTVP